MDAVWRFTEINFLPRTSKTSSCTSRALYNIDFTKIKSWAGLGKICKVETFNKSSIPVRIISKEDSAVQPLESVTVQPYTPGKRLSLKIPEKSLLHVYVYGLLPPLAMACAAPSASTFLNSP